MTPPRRILRAFVLTVCLTAVSAMLVACGGGGGGRLNQGFAPGPSQPPPSFPPPRDVPIDQALVAAAKQEIQALLRSDLPTDRAHAIETYRMVIPEEAAGPILEGLDASN